MRWQLIVSQTAQGPRVPLADLSASTLVDVLLSEVPPTERIAELLHLDPALALWALLQCDSAGDEQPESIADATHWLTGRLAGLLRQSLVPSEVAESPEIARDQFASLAGRSAAAAEISAALAESDDQPAAWLAGMLHYAPQWLTDDSPQLGVEGVLAKLAEHRPADLDRILALVETAATEELPAALPLERLHQAMQSAADRWQTAADAAGERLRALACRLARLEELEGEFDATLEREKIASLRQLAYGAGHEINNPLANISARAQTLIKEEQNPERRRRLAAINSQAFRAHEMIADLMLFAHPPALERTEFDLCEVVDELVAEMAESAQARGISLESQGESAGVPLVGDRVQIAAAVRACCINAVEAIGSEGEIRVRVRRARHAFDPGEAEICIADDGPGIAPEVRRHLFDPFYSGREAGRGLGFGLSKCYRIVEQHGGRVHVNSALGQGTQLHIYLPTGANALRPIEAHQPD